MRVEGGEGQAASVYALSDLFSCLCCPTVQLVTYGVMKLEEALAYPKELWWEMVNPTARSTHINASFAILHLTG